MNDLEGSAVTRLERGLLARCLAIVPMLTGCARPTPAPLDTHEAASVSLPAPVEAPPSTAASAESEIVVPEAARLDADEPQPRPSTAAAEPPVNDEITRRAFVAYRARILAWLDVHFRQPTQLPQEVLGQLSVAATVTVGDSREVLAFEVVRWSGNAAFDAAVRTALESIVGKQIPAPPPILADFPRELSVVYQGHPPPTANVEFDDPPIP